ncbi:MAG: GDP-mannose 4,6-dehydratase [Hyphomicrobium sp.]|nr:GDP-mannose 4,6-dehydratase [Hyphomicrobium sp.]
MPNPGSQPARRKTALICGISGQDGAYLAQFLIGKGYAVIGTSRDAELASLRNLARLGLEGRVPVVSMTLTDFRSVVQTLSRYEPDEIYNLAGQSSVGLSFQQPVETLESITLGTINLLEAVGFLKRPTRIYFAGSGECYGDTGGIPADENTAFKPRSPYATAKAASFWAVANYREAYGLHVSTGVLFNHESPLRPRRFVTRKIVSAAVAIARDGRGQLELGDISIQRDWGWAPEYVTAMWLMLQQPEGDDYVIATGRASRLEDFCARAFSLVGLAWRDHVVINEQLYRPAEIRGNCGNSQKAADKLGWRATLFMEDVVERMIAEETSEYRT